MPKRPKPNLHIVTDFSIVISSLERQKNWLQAELFQRKKLEETRRAWFEEISFVMELLKSSLDRMPKMFLQDQEQFQNGRTQDDSTT
jgi:hypothetical protein